MCAYDALSGLLFRRPWFPIKPVFILSCFLLITNLLTAATYYSNSGDPSVLTKWWTNTNGTGSHPSNFTTSGDIFVLQSGQTCATANNKDWTVGSGVTVRVDGSLSINGVNSDVIINGTIIFTNSSSTQVIMAGAGSGNSITINGTVKTANVNGLQGTNCSLIVNAFKKTVTYGASTIFEFNATSNQSTLGLPSSITDLIVNSTNNVTINSSTTITNTLSLTNGILVIPAGMTINITSGNAIAGSGFGNTKHINTQVNTST
ncbi:MAG: hypothetical protein JJE22_15790, partial [Bacteroidia bacterium]|nr:hypothetical protein [Bacteroidia bacterium]